jgi:hypothetical protein
VGKRKKCTSKKRKVIRFLRWSGQALGGARLGMWKVVGCVGSMRCPLETGMWDVVKTERGEQEEERR